MPAATNPILLLYLLLLLLLYLLLLLPIPWSRSQKALDDERAKNEGLVEKLAIVGAQLEPGQLDQIEGLHSQIATLKSQVNSWISKHDSEMRSRKRWEKKTKALEKKLGETILH